MESRKNHSIISNVFYIVRLFFSITPGLMVVNPLISIASSLPTRLVAVIGLRYIIDRVRTGDTDGIPFAIAVIAGIVILSESLRSVVFELYTHKQREKLSLGLNAKLYDKAASLDLSSYDDPEFYSDFILTLETSGANIEWISEQVAQYLMEIISFFTISAVVLTIDWKCLVITLFFVLIFIPVGRKHGDLLMKRRVAVTEKHRKADYFARLFYLPDYAAEIRMNGLSPLLNSRFGDAADDVIKTQKSYVIKIALLDFIQSGGMLIIGFMLCLCAYLGYSALVAKTMSVGDFVASFNGATMIGMSVMQLTVQGVRNFTERSQMIEKFRVFLAAEPEMKDGAHTAVSGKPERIELKGVSFTYPGGEKPALEDINMTMERGQRIALVGYNGAGKTTLTNLLLRLYDPTDGQILIGGRDIREETIRSHRDRFAAVFQDFRLFGATMGENVAMSASVNKARVMESLQNAGFTKELPDGADTPLLREFSDDGMMLSGGEEQKTAIARAFYKQCPYIILDEPSANLDPVSEYELNLTMARAMVGRTVVFISHRLSTTRHADKIYMLENGRIIEEGTHDELMALNGKYAYMFNLQAEKYQNSGKDQTDVI